MATHDQGNAKLQKEKKHDERTRKGLERRVPRDEDDHPAETPRQASVYEEPGHAPPSDRAHVSVPPHALRPSGYELGGFGGGPGDRPWQEPWTGSSGLNSLSELAARGEAASLPQTYVEGAGSAPPTTQATPPAGGPAASRPSYRADEGAFGGAGLGGYHEG